MLVVVLIGIITLLGQVSEPTPVQSIPTDNAGTALTSAREFISCRTAWDNVSLFASDEIQSPEQDIFYTLRHCTLPTEWLTHAARYPGVIQVRNPENFLIDFCLTNSGGGELCEWAKEKAASK